MAENYIRWLIPGRIIYYQIVGRVTSADNIPVDSQMLALLNESGTQHVHLLIDTSFMTHAPNVPATMRLSYLRHPKLGMVITQERSTVERFVFNTVGKLLKLSYRFVNTLAEGIEILSCTDSTLPPVETLRERLTAIQNEILDDYEN